jgi:hypothetical protein
MLAVLVLLCTLQRQFSNSRMALDSATIAGSAQRISSPWAFRLGRTHNVFWRIYVVGFGIWPHMDILVKSRTLSLKLCRLKNTPIPVLKLFQPNLLRRTPHSQGPRRRILSSKNTKALCQQKLMLVEAFGGDGRSG